MNPVKTTKRKKPGSPPSKRLSELIIRCMLDKKGYGVVRLHIGKIRSAVTDYFILCTCDSDTQVRAVADSIEEAVKKKYSEIPLNKEGYETSKWILLDYVHVVAHILYKPAREYYAIEDLWGDVPSEEFT